MTERTYAQRFGEDVGELIVSAKEMLEEIDRLGDGIPLRLKSAWGMLHSALVPFGAVEPIKEEPEPESACKGFQWIGQSWEHCNGCSRPAWEHEGYEEMGASSAEQTEPEQDEPKELELRPVVRLTPEELAAAVVDASPAEADVIELILALDHEVGTWEFTCTLVDSLLPMMTTYAQEIEDCELGERVAFVAERIKEILSNRE